jgi:thiol peroxidase
MNKNNSKVKFAGNYITLVGNEATVGEKAPDFTAVGADLKPVTLSSFDGKVKVISAFPSVDTGVCATQTRTFNKEAASLSSDIVIINISNDLPFAQKRFCGAEGIDKAITISDHKDVDFGTKYGFLIEELRLLARGVVVVDKDNVIKYVEYVPEVTTEPDYSKALEVAKSLV